jgi:hypothetical protein
MRKVIEYGTLLSAQYNKLLGDNLENMDALVSAALEDGWQPLGGVSIGDNNKVAQAMVKYGDDDEI